MSLTKNLINKTSIPPRPCIVWDKAQRIIRNKEIWNDPNSIVHRLPLHYKRRYWKNILIDVKPVHYRPPNVAKQWDPVRLVKIDTEHYPIIPIYPPEADLALWGGEGVVKGYRESNPFIRKKILPRRWLPSIWFPDLKDCILYSEVLDKHMKVQVTARTLHLIDLHFGLDLYILETADIDLHSKLGLKLKREILMSLTNVWYAPNDEKQRVYLKEKYSQFVMPAEETEWVGLDLNEACRKLQDLEDSTPNEPYKIGYEKKLLMRLENGQEQPDEEDKKPSLFGEKLLGGIMNPLTKSVKMMIRK